MSEDRAVDAVWMELDELYHIVERVDRDGIATISASEIKQVYEPRLATKFDHRSQLPSLFANERLSILPLTRGTYAIGRFSAYSQVDTDYTQPIRIAGLPNSIESVRACDIGSEAVALNLAYSSGILGSFLGEDELWPTVSGRQSSGSFGFDIGLEGGSTTWLEVENAQMEIDAGYESAQSLVLVEAKLHLCDDFLVRQLYYPYRAWSAKMGKPVRTVFLVYANKTYFLYEYAFSDMSRYDSAYLIAFARYSFEPTAIDFSELEALCRATPTRLEPDVPFPQANSLDRVLNLCEQLASEDRDREEISDIYDFVGRQADYYVAAARYLGLARKTGSGTVELTAQGKNYLSLGYRDSRLNVCELLFEHAAFAQAFLLYARNKAMPSDAELARIVSQHTRYGEATAQRRASTLKNWLRWIVQLTEQSTTV